MKHKELTDKELWIESRRSKPRLKGLYLAQETMRLELAYEDFTQKKAPAFVSYGKRLTEKQWILGGSRG